MVEQEIVVRSLARTLLGIEAGDSVRVLEAMAGAVLRRMRAGDTRLGSARHGLAEAPARFEPEPRRVEMCERIARRAVSGALADATRGANAWHRVGEAPPWARCATPVAEIGPFLFYRLADPHAVDGRAPAPHHDDRPPSAEAWMGGRVA
jgi:N-acetylmuramoyl-L-alanine amidase